MALSDSMGDVQPTLDARDYLAARIIAIYCGTTGVAATQHHHRAYLLGYGVATIWWASKITVDRVDRRDFFLPTIFCLNSGQITPLILLGLVGFLYFSDKQKWVLAGCMVFLVSIKPQLLALFWLALLLWVIKSRKWMVLLSALVTGIVALAIPVVFNPHIIPQYIEFSRNNLIYFYGIPLLSYALRAWFGLDKYWLQFIPMIFGIGWFILYWRRHAQDWQWLEHFPLVILVSFITASYGWIFDEIVYLPVLILITIWFANNIRQRWLVIIMYAAISFLLIEGYLANKQPNPWDLVQPLAFLGVYLVVAGKIHRGKVEIA